MEVTIRKKQNNLYINNKKVDIQKSYCFIIGNIYNLDDLYKFEKKQKSEEKILKLYELYQEKIFKKFNGEYALILIIKGKIILVRDRLGSKNLYYYQNKEEFICTNNLANIIKRYQKQLVIDKQQLANFLTYNYVIPPYTLIKNVYKIEAGCYIFYNDKLKKKKYYDMEKEYIFNYDKIKMEDKALQKIELELLNSLKLRINNHNKIAVFFSAGIDSTLITKLLTKLDLKNINTYTIGFYDEDRNEAVNAKKIAKYLKVNYHEYYLSEKDVMNLIPKIPTIYADLISDPSIIPMIFLNNKIKDEDIDVYLTGDGADQLYCGSNIYDTFYLKNKIKIILKYLANVFKGKKYSYQEIKDLYRLGLGREKIVYELVNNKIQSYNFVDTKKIDSQINFMLNDIKTFMSNRLFTKLSSPANYYNLHIAHPFVDNDFIKTTFRLSHNFKYRNGKKKYILKKLLFQNIPENMINNTKKGFGIPLNKWIYTLFKDDIKKYSKDYDLNKQNLFNINNIKKLITKLDNKRLNNKEIQVLFSYYMFQLWYYTYFDN